jgi:hypothetical protein
MRGGLFHRCTSRSLGLNSDDFIKRSHPPRLAYSLWCGPWGLHKKLNRPMAKNGELER